MKSAETKVIDPRRRRAHRRYGRRLEWLESNSWECHDARSLGGHDPWDDEMPDQGVTFRMTLNPFRIVPAWVREGAEALYEREHLAWSLGQVPMCPKWGVPQEYCGCIQGFCRLAVGIEGSGINRCLCSYY